MRLRTVLLIAIVALALSFILPGLLAHGLTSLLSWILGNDGWSFLAYLAVALIAGHWMQGMLWGVALLAPLAAFLEHLAPDRCNGRKLLVGLLAIWTVPALFVSRAVTPLLAEIRLTRPEPAECIAGVTVGNRIELGRGRDDGLTAILGILSNGGDLTLTSLEAEFRLHPAPDDPQGIVRTVLCDVVQRESWDSPGTKPVVRARTGGRFRCVVAGFEAEANPPTVEFVRFRSWSCKELGDRLYN